ncbi:MAG: TIGR01777 family oxidoreductase [Chloroflexi bacterium]|nr:TIGR01777 family oxidoreductase [Chloroflexota bacterium]
MRVIITGGSGLIGRALAASLAASSHEVIILSRSATAVDLPVGVRTLRWDGRTGRGWASEIDGTTAIVNLAGAGIAERRWTPDRRREILQSRVHAGKAVVEAVSQALAKPHVVVQSSAVGYYGPQKASEVTEENPPGSDFLAEVCVAWEGSSAAVEAQGVRRAIIRTGIVLSTRGGALPRLLLPFKLFAGGPVGSGQQWYPWIHLADEVLAIRHVIEHEESSGPYNLCAPTPVTNAQLSRIIGQTLGRPSFFPTPGFALRLIMGDMSTVVLDGQRAVPKRLLAEGFQFRFPTAEAALRDLLHAAA